MLESIIQKIQERKLIIIQPQRRENGENDKGNPTIQNSHRITPKRPRLSSLA